MLGAVALEAQQATPMTVSVVQSASSADNPLLGSVPESKAVDGVLRLSLVEALQRGLRSNLGALLSRESEITAEAGRRRAQNAFLPSASAKVAEESAQVDADSMAFPRQAHTPYVYGPSGIFDMRAQVQQSLLDLHSLRQYRAAQAAEAAEKFSYQNMRELVALAVGLNYLQTLSAHSRVEAAEAEYASAKAVYDRAAAMKQAGVVAGIEVLGAQVQMQAREQRMLVVRNDEAKQKLMLARVIGLADGQVFELTDTMPAPAAEPFTLDELLQRALANRNEYREAEAKVKAAELTLKAAQAEKLPTLGFAADYGVAGKSMVQDHGTYTAGVQLNVPLYTGTRVKAEVQQAEAALKSRQAQLDDMRGRIAYEVRSSWLDYQAATEQLRVAEANVKLARQQLDESQDRFSAGVTTNVEVTQAQEARATAEENFISSLFSHNYSKLALARAAGFIEEAVKTIAGGR